MKFIHISDLHLGKRLCERSLIDDQLYILNQIEGVVTKEKPNAVIIAGDVYDKSVPPAEAINLFDNFLINLANLNVKVFIISGNHDSADRIAFGGKFLKLGGVFVSPVYNGEITPVTLSDEYGEVDVYLLPFIKPSTVRRFFDGETIDTYTDAVRVAIKGMNVNETRRNILVTHQFVTGSTRSDSEETVGGTDNVDAEVFKSFDYVALGHLHSAQNCGSEKIRYSGTPLKYSFAEAGDEKSVTIVTLNEKEQGVKIDTVPLKPIKEMRKIRGFFNDLITANEKTDDYVQITLTDEEDVINAMSRLQTVYKNALNLNYDNTRTRKNMAISTVENVENKTTYELFEEFFKLRNNKNLTDVQSEYIKALIEKIEEDEA